MKKLIAIIPARSGSKGLKDKNIRLLNGKPLLAYSVEAAIGSGLFDIVHVSTDSQEYADIAKAYGADEPFLRDEQNSGDASSSWDAVREVLRKYKENGKEFDVCVLLQPTSPMRTAEDIKEAYKLFEEKKAISLTSATEVDHPVQWCFKLDKTFSMKDFASSPYKDCRRQELEKHYRENGAIYIVGTKEISDPSFDFYTDQSVAYIMSRSRSIDIDTLQDFIVAETIIKMQAEGTE
jgi:CMP-N,N'-diacetyllegionaminic acid synthase